MAKKCKFFELWNEMPESFEMEIGGETLTIRLCQNADGNGSYKYFFRVFFGFVKGW